MNIQGLTESKEIKRGNDNGKTKTRKDRQRNKEGPTRDEEWRKDETHKQADGVLGRGEREREKCKHLPKKDGEF